MLHARRLAHPLLARRVHARAEDESGAALVEFALVLPLLLVVLLGILDFGRALNYWIDETHLANEAARWAVVNKNPGPFGTLQQSVQQQADSAELRNGGTSSVAGPATVCISFPNGTESIGDPVQATVTATYNWLPFLGNKMGLAQTTIAGTATMRLEAAPTTYSAGCT